MVVVVMIVAARFHATVHVAMMHAFVHSFSHHRLVFSDSGRRNCNRPVPPKRKKSSSSFSPRG
jgi:hypothetical protein